MVQWATAATGGLPAIWDTENGPQPDRTPGYVVFSLMSNDDITGVWRIDDTNADTGNIERGYYKMDTVRVQVTALTDSNQYKEQLFLPAGIGLRNTLPTRRIPMLEDGVAWRSKALFEVEFNVASNQGSVENLIPVESVSMVGTLVTGHDGVDISIPETVPNE